MEVTDAFDLRRFNICNRDTYWIAEDVIKYLESICNPLDPSNLSSAQNRVKFAGYRVGPIRTSPCEEPELWIAGKEVLDKLKNPRVIRRMSDPPKGVLIFIDTERSISWERIDTLDEAFMDRLTLYGNVRKDSDEKRLVLGGYFIDLKAISYRHHGGGWGKGVHGKGLSVRSREDQ